MKKCEGCVHSELRSNDSLGCDINSELRGDEAAGCPHYEPFDKTEKDTK